MTLADYKTPQPTSNGLCAVRSAFACGTCSTKSAMQYTGDWDEDRDHIQCTRGCWALRCTLNLPWKVHPSLVLNGFFCIELCLFYVVEELMLVSLLSLPQAMVLAFLIAWRHLDNKHFNHFNPMNEQSTTYNKSCCVQK